MIPIRKIEYVLDESCDKVLSRLKWAVDDYELFWILLKNNLTDAESDTSKEWIGSLWEEEMKFKLIGSLGKIQIVVKGHLEKVGRGTLVRLQMRLGFYTWLLIVGTIVLFIGFFLHFFHEDDTEIMTLIFPITLFLVGVFSIYKKLKLIELNLDELFQDLPK